MRIRTEEDRVNLREGGRRLASILKDVSSMCVPGTTLKELDTRAQEMIKDMGDTASFLGYSEPPFPAALCLSVNSGIVHGIPDEYELKQGDLLTIDAGIWHEGLCTDAAVTVAVGTISEEDELLSRATLEALEAQIAVAVVGNTIGDIGYAAEQVAKKYGFGFPKELGGHGVGLAVHEQPFIANYGRQGSGEKLRKDDVLALEPMFASGKGKIALANDGWKYEMVDGSQSAHFEHTIIVGDDEAEVITRMEE